MFVAKKNDGGGCMKEGDYEVILVKCEQGMTRNMKPVIAFDFQVRQDVEQEYQRKHIFKNFYMDENGEWPQEKIGKLANSLGIEPETTFELADLTGLCCILHMKPMTGNDGVNRDVIFWSAPTKAGQMIQESSSFTEVEDEEIPF